MTPLLAIERAEIALARRLVVKSVTFAAPRGAIVALLGPNGAGKSSLIRAAMGLIPLAHGRARLYGADPRMMAPDLRARRAAYLPQKPEVVWPLRVDALVALGRYAHGAPPDRLPAADQEAVDAALTACGLNGLRARRMDEISGGERMRAHLARALAQGAPLLVLDEPTAGLDPAQALVAADIMRAHANESGAVVFSTHDVALAARVATQVLLLKDGVTVAQGAPREALTPDALEAAYGRRGRIGDVGGAVAASFD